MLCCSTENDHKCIPVTSSSEEISVISRKNAPCQPLKFKEHLFNSKLQIGYLL